MNLLNGFIDTGLDSRILFEICSNNAELVDSLGDLEKAFKPRNRSHLVPKRVVVNGKNGTYTAIRLVNPEDDEQNKGFFVREIKNPEEFHSILQRAYFSVEPNKRWRVTVHDTEEYKDTRMFSSARGSVFAISKSGDIISVCINQNSRERGRDLIKTALSQGGKTLDAFSGIFGFYSKCGLEPISWCTGDRNILEEYVQGWKESGCGVEDVVFWKKSDENSKSYKNFDDFKSKAKGFSDYDEAMSYRDRSVN